MQLNRKAFVWLLVTGALFALGAATQIQAQESTNAVGTYKWIMPGLNGGPSRTNTLVLKMEEGKLAGTVSTLRNNEPMETKIEDVKLADNTVSFAVTREINGKKIAFKYSGKLSAEGLKGKFEIDRDGQIQAGDWEAKLQPVEKK